MKGTHTPSGVDILEEGPVARRRRFARNVRHLQSAVLILWIAMLALGGLLAYEDGRVSKLNDEVQCLRHPTHGASSTAVERLPNGKLRTIQPPYATVC